VLLKADYGLEQDGLDEHIAAQGFVDVEKRPMKLPIGPWPQGIFLDYCVLRRCENETGWGVGSSCVLEGC
jgi:hypothetical protein